MADRKALAEQYVREYSKTSEFGNWDHVVELGKQLADAVIADDQSVYGGKYLSHNVPEITKEKSLHKFAKDSLQRARWPAQDSSINGKDLDDWFAQAIIDQAAAQQTLEANSIKNIVLEKNEQMLVDAGKLVQAVQSVLQRTGCTIADAKQFCEAYKNHAYI